MPPLVSQPVICVWNVGSKHGQLNVPCWMRITGYGVGLHEGAIPNPGSPASDGCLRLPRDMAEAICQHAPLGARVKIMQ